MAYLMKSKTDIAQRSKIYHILREGAREGFDTDTIVGMLKGEGLTYRRTNMLRDIRRARASELAKTPENRVTAMRWYDEVFEPFQIEHGLTPRETSVLWTQTVEESWDTLEQAERGAEFWEWYKTAF